MTLPTKVSTKNREEGQQTHTGLIHSRSQVPNMGCAHCPCKEKNGQLRVCVDFRDLNDGCPKDDSTAYDGTHD